MAVTLNMNDWEQKCQRVVMCWEPPVGPESRQICIFLRKHLSCKNLEYTFDLKTPDVCLLLLLSTSFPSSLFCSLYFLFPFLSLYHLFSLLPLFPASLFPSSFNLSLSSFIPLSTSTFSTLSKKLILLPDAFGYVIWGHLEKSEVFLEMKRLYKRLLGTRLESTCVGFKFSKLDCYTAIKNDGFGNYEMAWKQLIHYI